MIPGTLNRNSRTGLGGSPAPPSPRGLVEHILVGGLPRCGSSLTMQMLDAGGMRVFGSFPSYEGDVDVAELAGAWRALEEPHVIKVIDPLAMVAVKIEIPPASRVIWLCRDFEQQARSQIKFFRASTPGLRIDAKRARGKLLQSLRTDTFKSLEMLGLHLGYARSDRDLSGRVLRVNFETLIARPAETASLFAGFLGRPDLDIERMARQVRKRGPEARARLLEYELVAAGGIL